MLMLISNRRGQVAFFIALIFQVLFLFFAMVVNVGLLVHHKINLQSSVDMAAYYGAMKQAELMNAIAHTNYQIRQSWKLLAWRYRNLGTAGDFSAHPLGDHQGFEMPGEEEFPPEKRDFFEAPAFCITYRPFQPMPPEENTCKDLLHLSGVQLWGKIQLAASFQGFSQVIIKASEAMREAVLRRCQIFGAYNYTMLAKFLVSFNIDQSERSQLIRYLSRQMSKSKDDFPDIEGESVAEGIKKTLRNNLTLANSDGMDDRDIQIFNSLASEQCNGTGRAPDQPPKWLTPVRIYPDFNYVDTKCETEMIRPQARELNNRPGEPAAGGGLPRYYQDPTGQIGVLRKLIDYLKSFVGFPSDANSSLFLSMGVEKNPWCVAYVGVSAQSNPRIPFAPLGGVTLKARAFAKPFGGRIGPWYGRSWPSGSPNSVHSESDTNSITDPLLPPRIFDLSNLSPTAAKSKTRAANYSRYVGDKFGLMSQVTLATYGRAIYALSPEGGQSLKIPGARANNNEPNFAYWDHLGNSFKLPMTGGGDLLAWNHENSRAPQMRFVELSAILPDPFDITYYSIEPDFYNNYLIKLKKYVSKVGGFEFDLRPDLGFRAKENSIENFNILQQYKTVWEHNDDGFPYQRAILDPLGSHLNHISKNWESVLTGWAEKSFQDYSLDVEKFGNCKIPVEKADKKQPAPGNCIVGGRTGYSVKLVSKDYLLKQQLELGGEGVRGPLLNPPDSKF